MIVTDLRNSFNPYPKDKPKEKKESKPIKKKSKKLAKKEKDRYSILTDDLEHCYICKKAKKSDIHEIFGGRNRQMSMKYGLVIPICRKCHSMIEKNETLKKKWHKDGQKVFEKHYKTENFEKVFGKNYL